MAYIKKERLLAVLLDMSVINKLQISRDIIEKFRRIVDSQPTADVVEVRHGEWIYHECVSSHEGAISGYSCSVCSSFVDDEVFESENFHKKYCGNCGAKMDGGQLMKNCKDCAVLQRCDKATHIENYKILGCSEFKYLYGERKINPVGHYPCCSSCGEKLKNNAILNCCPNCGIEIKERGVNT